ncbi:MAG: methionyl-tRNA formyltransferase [Minisyncoccia bacterium]
MRNFLFFGSSEFSKMILEGLIKANFKPSLVVAPERKPQGRKKFLIPSPVEDLALKENIPVLTPSNLNEKSFLTKIKNLKADFALLSAYGKIIPLKLLKMFPKGFLNLHPSLLPRLRGATPIQTAILNDDKESGVTLFLMDEKIDHGPIIQNIKYKIQDTKITYTKLSQILAQLGTELIIKTIPLWLEDKIIPQPQNDALATYCHKITKEDEKINWEKNSIEIDRQIRAFNPQPGTYTTLDNKIIKIIKGENFNDNNISENKKIGEIFEFNGKLAIKCGKGFYVVEIIKPEGKKEMDASDFLKGNKYLVGKIFI